MWLRRRDRCFWRPMDDDFFTLFNWYVWINITEEEETPAGQDYLLIFFILQLVTSLLWSQESLLQALYSVEIFSRVKPALNMSFLIILSPLYWILSWINQNVPCLVPNIVFSHYWSVLDLISDLGILPTGSSAIPARSGFWQVLLIIIWDTI